MNDYESKREARRERLRQAAIKIRAKADGLYDEAQKMGSIIPMGQPILIGHHSEKSDRYYRARMGKKYDKAFKLMKLADEYAGRAESVSNAISSDDEDAPAKLRQKIANAKQYQDQMKRCNAIIRKMKNADGEQIVAALVTDGLPDTLARVLILVPKNIAHYGRGFQSFQLTNNNANIRRMEARLSALEAARTMAPRPAVEMGGVKIEDSVEENRVMIFFPNKPSEAARTTLKRHGFKWSPTRGAWVRMLNDAARRSAEYAVKQITGGQNG